MSRLYITTCIISVAALSSSLNIYTYPFLVSFLQLFNSCVVGVKAVIMPLFLFFCLVLLIS